MAVTFNAGGRFKARAVYDDQGELVVDTREHNKLGRRIVRSVSRQASSRIGKQLLELWSLRRHAPRRRQVLV